MIPSSESLKLCRSFEIITTDLIKSTCLVTIPKNNNVSRNNITFPNTDNASIGNPLMEP